MEYLILFIELLLISLLVFRLSVIVKRYKNLGNVGTFPEKIEIVMQQTFPKTVAVIVSREISMIYYLFTKKSAQGEGEHFTYHKGVGYKGILIALISVILIESIGLYFLIHRWNMIIAWIHIGLNVYGLLYLVSDYRAIVHRPFVVYGEALKITLGSRRQITIPFSGIDSIESGIGFEKEKKNKDIFKAVLLEFDTPQFKINLKEPILIVDFLGRPQEISNVYITVDDKERFHRLLVQHKEVVGEGSKLHARK